jgi:putative endonuclease
MPGSSKTLLQNQFRENSVHVKLLAFWRSEMISLLYRLADRARDSARRRQWHADLASGQRGEDLAHRFLRRLGFIVVARNYRPHSGSGEIDIIAWEKERLVIVEVKTRLTLDFGAPDRAVDSEKQMYIQRAAREYARRAGVEWDLVRFDIVGILLTRPPRIELLRDAFRPGRTL